MSPADRTFVELFRRHERGLLAYCRTILRDDSEARDALQNTVLRALVAVREERVRTNAHAWL